MHWEDLEGEGGEGGGGGIGMGNTCKPMAVSFQCMTKFTTNKKKKKEYWGGLLFPSPGDLPDPGIKPKSSASPALTGRFFTTALPGKPYDPRKTLKGNQGLGQFPKVSEQRTRAIGR